MEESSGSSSLAMAWRFARTIAFLLLLVLDHHSDRELHTRLIYKEVCATLIVKQEHNRAGNTLMSFLSESLEAEIALRNSITYLHNILTMSNYHLVRVTCVNQKSNPS